MIYLIFFIGNRTIGRMELMESSIDIDLWGKDLED